MAVTSSLPAVGVAEELANLDRQEREISRQRRLVHQRIDRLYLSAPLDHEDTALLDELEALEQRISSNRGMLHRRIDELRAHVGLAPYRPDNERLNDA